jgi:hypothetical protein
MQRVSQGSFGFVIAYLVPGLVALSIAADFLPAVESWLSGGEDAPSVGGFLYGTLAALGSGLTISALRWLTLDQLHHCTGLAPPKLDFAHLHRHFEAHQGAVENHYRYYQFYGNMLLAIALIPLGPSMHSVWLADAPGRIIGGLLIVVYFLASRDSLSKYYARTAAMLTLFPISKEQCDDERLAPAANGTEEEAGPA